MWTCILNRSGAVGSTDASPSVPPTDWCRYCALHLLVEKHPRYLKLSEELFRYLNSSEVYGSTSIIALIEACIYPQRQGRTDLVTIYENALLHSQQVQMWPVNVEIAHHAVQLRAEYNIHIPDALHLANAITAGATLFVTNDRRLQKINEIEVLSFEDYVID